MTEDLQRHFREVASIDHSAVAVYFGDETFTWGDLWRAAEALEKKLDAAGVKPGQPVGWIARNHPAMIGAALGLLMSGRCLCPINPLQPVAKLAAEVERLRMPALVGIGRDWPDELDEAVRKIGALGLVVDLRADDPITLRPGADKLGEGPFRVMPEGTVVERMSSGTTGEPKRIPVTSPVLERSMQLGRRSEKGGDVAVAPSLQRSPSIQSGPFGHASGIFHVAMMLHHGRPMVLFEKFDAQAWTEAVARFKPKAGSLVPSMLNMVLELNPPKEKLASLICVRSGTGPLDPASKTEFEARYGIPVLSEYGASEFIGGIAGWSLADYQAVGREKAASVGRLRPDANARVINAETGEELANGQIGVLCLKAKRWGPDWIQTTDLASLDDDGFLYIHGRADEAINRGGFKVLPEKVAEVLRMHPAVRDAAVLAIKDPRLGQAPLAVVEAIPGQPAPSAEELQALVRANMPSYNVPVAVEMMDELPRTPSMKVARPAVRERLAGKYAF